MQGQHFLKSPGEPICTQLSEAQWLQESRVVGDGPLDLSHLPMDGGGGLDATTWTIEPCTNMTTRAARKRCNPERPLGNKVRLQHSMNQQASRRSVNGCTMKTNCRVPDDTIHGSFGLHSILRPAACNCCL